MPYEQNWKKERERLRKQTRRSGDAEAIADDEEEENEYQKREDSKKEGG